MATQVKHRRGNTSEIEAFTPAVAEIVVDTDTNELVVGDGVTVGGHRVGKQETPMGIKVTRSDSAKHYGWGSTAVLPDGRWMQIFRSGAKHGTENGTKIMLHYSDDQGSTWYGEKNIFQQADSDARPDGMYVMAYGRIGFILNRASDGGPHYPPLFMYTDDEGATWNNVTITMSSPYTFSAVGGIIEFPTSQGGDDTEGFVTFGFANAGQLDALTTVDNGANWTIVSDINGVAPPFDSISETCYARLGNQDRWLIYSRARTTSGWADQSAVFATTNLLDWGTPLESGILNKGTPPAVVYNEETGDIDFYVVERTGRDLYDYDNALLLASEDANVLWAAQGVFSSDPVRVAEIPNWFTGYLYPFKSGKKSYFTMMFGENPSSGADVSVSSVAVLSDAPTSTVDASTLARVWTKYMQGRRMTLKAGTNATTEPVLTLTNTSETASSIIGPYEDRHSMGGTEYLSYYSDDYKVDVRGNYTLDVTGQLHIDKIDTIIGSNTDLEGLNAALHLSVASTSSGSLVSHSYGTTSARTHVTFTNVNGITGSIVVSGTSTAYNTSSDPRLKTEFSEVTYDEVRSVLNNLYGCAGKFQFKGDLDTDVVGFDAHAVLDIQGLGSEIATEGNGSRDKSIGEIDGVDEDGKELRVSPASVDQSKLTPYLLLAVKTLMDKVEELESKLEG